MPTLKLGWKGQRKTLETASVLLTDTLWPPAEAVSLTRAEPLCEDTPDWLLEAYFTDAPDLEAIAEVLRAIGLVGPSSVETLPDIDWVAHSLEGLGVVNAGRFRLYGAHDEDKIGDDPDMIPIRIDANQAFGTGHHPTTAGCLELLDRIAGVEPRVALDLGAGSAVLAIAASKVWSCPIVAADIDETSIRIARENAALNAADRIEFAVADGFDHPAIKTRAPYDFIFANILAGPLIEFAPAMAAHTAPGGRVLLAGLMTEQEAKVTAAYEGAGFRRLNRIEHKVWPILLFVKAPA